MGTVSNYAGGLYLAVAVIAMVSGTAGWVLGQRVDNGGDSTVTNRAATHAAEVSLAFKTSQGSATVEPIGNRAVPVRTLPNDETTVASASTCELADDGAGAMDVALLERTLAEGTEAERYAALTEALQSESDVPPRLFQRTYVSDLAESVRLLAFKAYVDSISDDRKEVRDTLESGVYDMSTAVQAEARRRLAELERYEVMLATLPPQGY